jgi:PAS domain S-box
MPPPVGSEHQGLAMSVVQYPFIDIAVHERIRDRFAAGDALVLFSADLTTALWANGRGAELFGFSAIYDLLEQGPKRADVAFRQLEAAARQLGQPGDNRSFTIRIASGFQRVPVQASCELVEIHGKPALLFGAPVDKLARPRNAVAAEMIKGFDDPDTHMAVIDADGTVLASSPDFDALQISAQTTRMLATMAGSEPSRLVKRPIPTVKGYLPAALGKLSDDPALHLLFTVEAVEGRSTVEASYEQPDEAPAAPTPQTYADAISAVSEIEEADEPEEEISLDVAVPVESDPEPAVADEAPSEEPPVTARAPEPQAEAVEAGEEPVAAKPAGFVFQPGARATRFVWKIDAEGRFSEVSSEFAEAVGPHAADINGMAFTDLASLFHLDPDGKVAELLSKRDTWSGKTIWWPVEGTALVVPVDLAALPTYTRTREFDGFRGFGIVRLADVAEDPNAIGLTLSPTLEPEGVEEAEPASSEAPEHPPFSFEPEDATDEPLESHASDETVEAPVEDNAAKTEVDETAPEPDVTDTETESQAAEPTEEAIDEVHEEPASPHQSGRQIPSLLDWPQGERPALRIIENPGRRTSDKIIKLEEHRSNRRDGLSPVEQAAFREIARQLDSVVHREPDEPQAPEEPVSVADETPTDALTPDPTLDENIAPTDTPAEPTEDPVEDTAREAPVEPEEEIEATAPTEEQQPSAETEEASEPEAVNPTEDETVEASSAEIAPETEPSEELSDQELLRQMIPMRERIGLSAEIIDQMPVALLVHSGDVLIHGNPEFLRLTGYASLDDLIEIGGLDALLQRQDLEGKTAQAGGMVVVRADDELVPVTARLQSVRWDDTTALMLALMPVATEVAPTEGGDGAADVIPLRPDRSADQMQRLQVEVEELRAILETATDGVVIIGAEGDIRSINRAASALFNYDNEEITGKPFVTLFAHESQRAIVDYLSGLSGHGVASVLNDGREVIGREANGGFLPLFMTIGKLTSSNGYCAVIRDITQWKRTEDELRSAKRAAETANAHKSEFLAHVSHEIRTPLNAIIGFADMMATERFGPVGHPRYIEYAHDIGRSGRHVLDIVNDLLDISKIEAGELDLDFVAVGLNETVSEAVSIVQPQANSQRVIIRTALSHTVPQVVADLRSVKQIVLNILANAIRFTPSGGQIVVSTAYEANGSVVLRVRDTGIGMTRSELELAMKPFRQIGAARNRGDGTGLGLPLTKAMVDANRAAFSISSAPNEGTLVEITFPSPRVLAT